MVLETADFWELETEVVVVFLVLVRCLLEEVALVVEGVADVSTELETEDVLVLEGALKLEVNDAVEL